MIHKERKNSMRILCIEATRTEIRFYLDEDIRKLLIYERVATVARKPGRRLSTIAAAVCDRVAVIPRFEGAHDRLFSRWTAYADDKALEGVCYVTKIADDVPHNDQPYPETPNINCICRPWAPEARTDLGACQTQFDVNLPAYITLRPGPEDIPYEWDGEIFYFNHETVEETDSFLLSEPDVVFTGVMVNHIPGSNPHGRCMEKEHCHPEDINAFIHPGYDWDCPYAYLGGFDMQTEEGLRYFCAFMDFLGNRYSRPDKKYGHIAGYIVSNEINSQYNWGNVGEMPVEQFCEEYTQAMRLTWLATSKYWKAIRVYASFDHFWSAHFDPTQPQRFYSARHMTDLFLKYSLRDGNFPWNMAHHPYPENLTYPDFWNDRTAEFSFDTPRITYKNMEVLEAYLGQEQFLYEGRPRRIVFSEQSLNSKSGALSLVTEKQAAAGYILSYLKARKMKTLDMMMHRLLDDAGEFGLNLGLYRQAEDLYSPEKPFVADISRFGPEKLICDCVRAVDTPREAEYIEMARNFIGPEIFDYILDPPPIVDVSTEREFEIVTH